MICLHPLPTHGGMMDSHLFRKASYRLPALAGIAVLRFNTRGTSSLQGTSEGEFDNAVGERFDVAAAVEHAEFADLPHLWIVGWSFGTDLALMYGLEPSVEGIVLLSPPIRPATAEHLKAWADSGKPVTALIPEHDDYLQPPEARERFAAIPQAEVIAVDGAKHLWVGDSERVLDEIVKKLAPGVPVPLPDTWDGPMERADSSAYSDRTVAAFEDCLASWSSRRPFVGVLGLGCVVLLAGSRPWALRPLAPRAWLRPRLSALGSALSLGPLP